ncbi:GSCFA domain-containing protein [Sphingomonas sp. RB3P16]|uniref:GSCFA domain-containing protein n=1 Tax=Parasphingomonas frigoris TaxID=3096163 RepID=UPI002FC7E256
MTNPYRGLEDYRFWSKAMSAPQPGRVDPVTRGGEIAATDKVATMGSCFAQHIARRISDSGLNYFVPEAAPADMAPDVAASLNFGVFSARYGNIYTVRQARQLFDRAFGTFTPQDDVWTARGDAGGYVDAFRPQIQSTPFSSVEEVRVAATEHLAHVRRIFLESDWLVFTLGLTEGWESKVDGAVYPLAPGVGGGAFDTEKYAFHNFTAAEVTQDLKEFIERVHSVNPKLKIILTVSPVPLIATYEQRHVWVSTTFSKAALRVAADEAERCYDFVRYFPSYEVITSPAAGGRYYADDLREVRPVGVQHVMRLFSEHFFPKSEDLPPPEASGSRVDLLSSRDIVCDEEAIEQSLKASGF